VSLDPVLIRSEIEKTLLPQLQRGLTQINAEGKTVGDLAESWSISAGGKKFSFVLAKAFWIDGVAIQAKDFVFAWKRLLAPGSPLAPSAALWNIQGAKEFHQGIRQDFRLVSIRAEGDRLLEIELNNPSPNFLTDIASSIFGPQREDVFFAHPTDFSDPLHYRASGPYQPLEWKKGESLLFVVNSYYPAPPSIAKIQFLFQGDEAAQKAFEQGNTDIWVGHSGVSAYGPRVVAPKARTLGFPPFQLLVWK
jgi:oligopeptide transport system substrate-binding protein